MNGIKPASALERIAGNTATESTLTLVSAMAGGVLTPLLPILANSLASERQRLRVEDALRDIQRTLSEHERILRDLTDSQYKLLNEAILALLHTTHVEKFEYLRRVVSNTLNQGDIAPQEAIVLSRIVRDISATELAFVVRNFSFTRVWLTTIGGEDGEKVINVHPSSSDAVVVTGLVSLGLLLSGSSDYAALGMLSWSPITAKLLALLREPAP